MIPTNWKNNGKSFEHAIETVITQYSSKSILSLRKVDPPTRTFGKGAFKRTIFLENPFLDFVGSWMERGGRAVFLEVKSTSEDTLRIGDDKAGVTVNQLKWMRHWRLYGAAVGLLWELDGQVRFVLPQEIETVLETRRSLKWGLHGEVVPPGLGFVYFDFILNLRFHYPDA